MAVAALTSASDAQTSTWIRLSPDEQHVQQDWLVGRSVYLLVLLMVGSLVGCFVVSSYL